MATDVKRRRRDPNLEPYMTLTRTRLLPKVGAIFGTYHQFIVLPSQPEFGEILPDFNSKAIEFNPQTRSALIKTGDKMMIRVQKRFYQVAKVD